MKDQFSELRYPSSRLVLTRALIHSRPTRLESVLHQSRPGRQVSRERRAGHARSYSMEEVLSSMRVKSHSQCSLEPQAHLAAPSALCIPAPQPEGAGPGDLGEVALREKDQRSGVKRGSLVYSFVPPTPPHQVAPSPLSRTHCCCQAARKCTKEPWDKPRPGTGGSGGDFRNTPARSVDGCY